MVSREGRNMSKQHCDRCGSFTEMAYSNSDYDWCEYCEASSEAGDDVLAAMFNMLEANLKEYIYDKMKKRNNIR